MEDIFDQVEKTYKFLDEYLYLVKILKNKRKQRRTIFYLDTISQDGRVTWTRNIDDAIILYPKNHTYKIIRDEIRKYGIKCQILRVSKDMKVILMPDKKEDTLWDKVKKLYKTWETFLIG